MQITAFTLFHLRYCLFQNLDLFLESTSVIYQLVSYQSVKLLSINTKLRFDFLQSFLKVVHFDLTVSINLGNLIEIEEIITSVETETSSTFDYSFDFCSSVVLGDGTKVGEVDRGVEQTVLDHVGCVDFEDVEPALLVGQSHLDLHFESSWPQQSLVNQV